MTEGPTTPQPRGITPHARQARGETSVERARLVAWDRELRAVHERLRAALRATQQALDDGASARTATRDLLLFCHGFCVALTGHHHGEDRTLFPAIAAAHPELADTLRKLEQDHSMIGYLVAGLEKSVAHAESPEVLARHVEGIAAIMESHFRFEERALLTVLEGLRLEANVAQTLGPL